MPPTLPTRLPLGRTSRRLPFERRLRLWLLALSTPTLALASALVFLVTRSTFATLLTATFLAIALAIASTLLFDQLTRPLQTLSNVVAALREDDFSFRARGARREDSLGDLALEINALAATLQGQRTSAMDALTLVERVLTSMPSPVLAFTNTHHLRLLNPAAAHAFHLHRQTCLGRSAHDLHLAHLLSTPDQGVYTPPPQTASPEPQSPHSEQAKSTEVAPKEPATPPQHPSPNPTRWSVRQSTFRLHGVPHTLFVLTDLSSALREEERLAWQRLIRVLGHEINNSLTPIKSIAGSLRSRLPPPEAPTQTPSSQPDPEQAKLAEAGVDRPAPQTASPITPRLTSIADLDRGLTIIEDRADSLNRFLQAYQRLSRLPAPHLQPTPLSPLAHRIAALETRLPIHLLPSSPDLVLLADPDQLQQLLINLLRNAVDAALSPESPTQTPSSRPGLEQAKRDEGPVEGPASPSTTPQVTLSWHATPSAAILQILDNGPGLTNPANLFVPFYTTKPDGSGIGLVLAQQIVSAHHGTLTLTNRPHHAGCQAEIRLPLAPPPSQIPPPVVA